MAGSSFSTTGPITFRERMAGQRFQFLAQRGSCFDLMGDSFAAGAGTALLKLSKASGREVHFNTKR